MGLSALNGIQLFAAKGYQWLTSATIAKGCTQQAVGHEWMDIIHADQQYEMPLKKEGCLTKSFWRAGKCTKPCKWEGKALLQTDHMSVVRA